MRVRVVAIAAAVLLSAMMPARTDACTCTELPPVCQAYWEAATVFLGTATDATIVEVPIGQGTDTYPQLRVHFSVDEAFRGVAEPAVDVFTAPVDTLCGYPFHAGTQYLVYANVNEAGRVVTSLCTRTRPSAEAEDDLKYIRDLSQSGTTGRVSGVVLLYTGSGSSSMLGPLEGMKVTLSNGRLKYRGATDAAGGFEVTDVEAGEYLVRVKMPSGAATDYRATVTVNGSGCTRLVIEARVREKSKQNGV
jgi:hypothetical protein